MAGKTHRARSLELSRLAESQHGVVARRQMYGLGIGRRRIEYLIRVGLLHRIFRGVVGETVAEHIRRLRLERAAQRLKSGERPVTEIAFEAGYEAHEAFTRAFRARFGASP